MPRSPFQRQVALSWLAATLLFTAGCVVVQIKKPIASFAGLAEKSAESMLAYYAELNRFERELYLERRLYDPDAGLALVEDHKPTPILGAVFPAESIKARTDVLRLVALYAKRLQDLATSDAPDQLAEGAKPLGERLEKLGETFGKLTGDPSASRYGDPIASIVTAIGSMYLEQSREARLRAAIQRGAPAVRQVLDLGSQRHPCQNLR